MKDDGSPLVPALCVLPSQVDSVPRGDAGMDVLILSANSSLMRSPDRTPRMTSARLRQR